MPFSSEALKAGLAHLRWKQMFDQWVNLKSNKV